MENGAKNSQVQGAGMRVTEAYEGTAMERAGTRNAATETFNPFNND